MKQRITVEQLRELTPEQQERLREWWKPENGDYFSTQYEENRWSYNNMVGACVGYNNCEVMIDDGGNPSEQPEFDSLPMLSIGQMIELLKDLAPSDIWLADNVNTICLLDDTLCDRLWESVKAIL